MGFNIIKSYTGFDVLQIFSSRMSPVHVGFVVNKVPQGQFFFPPSKHYCFPWQYHSSSDPCILFLTIEYIYTLQQCTVSLNKKTSLSYYTGLKSQIFTL